MEIPKTPEELKNKKSYETLVILISVFSLVAAVVGIVFQVRSERTRELTCNVILSSELTSVSAVPGLTSEFAYNNRRVAHLWKISLNFVNTGNETLIGEGLHNNLMYGSLLFEYPADTEILNYDVPTKDLPVTIQLAKTEQSQANGEPASETNDLIQPNKFRLKFAQWRPGEKVTVSMYVASSRSKESELLPSAPLRDIVDGAVVIRNSLSDQRTPKRSAIERLPTAVSITVKALVSLICFVLAWFGLVFVPKGFVKFLILSAWKKKHLVEFGDYVNALPDLSETSKKHYIERPDLLPVKDWESYPGTKPKVGIKSALPFDTLTELTTIGFGGFFLGVACFLYLATNIVDLFNLISLRI